MRGQFDRATAVDGGYAWARLAVSLLVATIGGVSLWSVAVVLPAVQAEFGIDRAGAALPYTMVMAGFVIGGPVMGWLSDRWGIAAPLGVGSILLALGFVAASEAGTASQFVLAHGLLIGIGGSASFGPVIADISLWFERHRGIAVAIAACGSYLAGTVWPLVIHSLAQAAGWRQTYLLIGLFCAVALPPLLLALRRPPPLPEAPLPEASGAASAQVAALPTGLTRNRLQLILMLAGVFCCAAMAMPQVHIVAYCVDLGYGGANGAQMLSLMLATGIVSRLGFGWIADRIGPLPALLLSSSLQGTALLLYAAADGLVSLYLVTALFGLVQGGIVPTYALVIREYCPAAEAGTRVGLVLSSTLAGMAVGGWLSGAIFDATGSYRAAFLQGFAWNLLNLAVAVWLLWRLPRRQAAAA